MNIIITLPIELVAEIAEGRKQVEIHPIEAPKMSEKR